MDILSCTAPAEQIYRTNQQSLLKRQVGLEAASSQAKAVALASKIGNPEIRVGFVIRAGVSCRFCYVELRPPVSFSTSIFPAV